MNQLGYQADFLGADYSVAQPEISPQSSGKAVRSDNLRNGLILDYPNYSVVMNRETRQALYSAANADFNNNQGQGRDFRLDTRIDRNLQLDDIYYRDLNGMENPYDRGHLTRRAAVAWGISQKQANDASRDSCFFTNISLQHKNFNQDEWHALEKAIQETNLDIDNRFNIFVGPVFTDLDRFVMPSSTLAPGRIPSAFWKIITYIGKDSKQLEANAFLVFQDEVAISAMDQVLGNNDLQPFDLYQTSTTLIEELTGLQFPDPVFENNPMFFFENDFTQENNIITPQLNRVTPLGNESQIVFSQ
jgi:endonuclease G, mitochondrial